MLSERTGRGKRVETELDRIVTGIRRGPTGMRDSSEREQQGVRQGHTVRLSRVTRLGRAFRLSQAC
ncbi:hypothetical protein GCM10010524_69550 [Streptomyces mexicanus]